MITVFLETGPTDKAILRKSSAWIKSENFSCGRKPYWKHYPYQPDEWQHADDSALLRALCREHDTIKRGYKNTIWIQHNLESLSKDLKAEIKRLVEDEADFGSDGTNHIIQLDIIKI